MVEQLIPVGVFIICVIAFWGTLAWYSYRLSQRKADEPPMSNPPKRVNLSLVSNNGVWGLYAYPTRTMWWNYGNLTWKIKFASPYAEERTGTWSYDFRTDARVLIAAGTGTPMMAVVETWADEYSTVDCRITG